MLKIETPRNREARDGEIALIVNGRRVATALRLLSEVVAEQRFGEGRTATAVNGNFVPAALRATTELADGDRVEIVSARQGG